MSGMTRSAAAPVWKTAQLGLHDSIDAYREALRGQPLKIGTWGENILGKIHLIGRTVEVPLYRRCMDDYGLGDASYESLYYEAWRDGFIHCPPETLPALRLSYVDQPRGEWIGMGLEDLDARVPLLICGVGHDFENRWLCGGGLPQFRWPKNTPFLFTRTT